MENDSLGVNVRIRHLLRICILGQIEVSNFTYM